MKLVSKKLLGNHEVYEITVKDEQHYILENGLVSHNTGIMYSSNIVFIIGRSQEKTGTEIDGYTFTINIDKSRDVKEKSKVSFKVMHNQGIRKYSGLLPIALESGHVIKVSNGWYSKKDNQEKRYRESQLESSPEFWESILQDRTFNDFINQKFQYNGQALDSESQQEHETDD